MSRLDPDEPGATLRWVELAEALRATETALLHALALVRGVEPGLAATTAIALPEHETAALLIACDEVAERAERAQLLADALRPGEVEIRLAPVQVAAEAALSAGVADVERVLLLARCLTVRSGFQALAASLRCSDCHEAWEGVSIGQVLGCFRGADRPFVRRVTGLAALSPDAAWERCDRAQIARLAAVLEQHAATDRCR